LMLGTVASTLVSRMAEKDSIYTKRISLLGKRIFSGRNLEYLRSRTVSSLARKDIPVIREDSSFSSILDLLINSTYTSFPVCGTRGELVGLISMRDIQPILFDRDLYPLLIARDVMSENVFVLTPEMTLEEAFLKVELGDYEMLPVVEDQASMKYFGMITQDDLLKIYRKEMLLMMDQDD